jgi:hypothetical protein
MFFGGYKEAEKSIKNFDKHIVEIKETSAKVFKELYYFLYTGQIKITVDNLFDIFQLADRYMLNDLQTLCRNQLQKILEPSTAIPLLLQLHSTTLVQMCDQGTPVISDTQHALSHQAVSPKSQIQMIQDELYSYILSNARSIFSNSNEDIKMIPAEIFLNLLKADDLWMNEKEVLELAKTWLNTQVPNEELLKKTKTCIRFSCLPQQLVWTELDGAKVWDRKFCSQDEIHTITKDFYFNKTINPRKNCNSWYLSKCETPFEIKHLGDDEAIVCACLNYSYQPNYNQACQVFSLGNSISWFLSLYQKKEDNIEKLFILLNQHELDFKKIIEAEFELLMFNHKDIRKSISHKAKAKFSRERNNSLNSAYFWGYTLLPCSFITVDSGFLYDGKVLIQAKIKLLKIADIA